MQTNEKRYKRLLVVNDDGTKEDFMSKYKGMDVWEKDIIYCQSINEALAYLESENRFCCDKILLDIKISWKAEDKYMKGVLKLVDVDRMEPEYGGFILFMYLLAKGFPINRIAFLSAYITEEDSEKTEKEQVREFLKNQKFRKEKTDEELKKQIEKVPSQKEEMLRILGNPTYGARDLKPYQEIERLLEKDLNQIELTINQKEELDEIKSAKDFFAKIKNTGLIVENKINKGNTGKLVKWLQEEEGELEGYYAFRTAALNICDMLIDFYVELEEKKNQIQEETSRIEGSQEDWMRKLVLDHSKLKELDGLKKEGFTIMQEISCLVSWKNILHSILLICCQQ